MPGHAGCAYKTCHIYSLDNRLVRLIVACMKKNAGVNAEPMVDETDGETSMDPWKIKEDMSPGSAEGWRGVTSDDRITSEDSW